MALISNLDEFEIYILARLNELTSNSASSAWDFICIASLIDYLASLTKRSGEGARHYYPRFIRSFYPREYGDFVFGCGSRDLPEQMYYIFRCGLVHSFSLSPDPDRKDGRDGSILLSHDAPHLMPTSKPPRHADAVILNFKDIADHTEKALVTLMTNLRRTPQEKLIVLRRLEQQPPLLLVLPP